MTNGTYELFSAETFPQPPLSITSYCWKLRRQKSRLRDYDQICFELATSSILDVYHNSRGYKTAVLARLVKEYDGASILLDSVLAEAGHSFTDPENGFRLEIVSINSNKAIIRVHV